MRVDHANGSLMLILFSDGSSVPLDFPSHYYYEQCGGGLQNAAWDGAQLRESIPSGPKYALGSILYI